MLSFKQYLNEFLIPQEMLAAAGKGVADANREMSDYEIAHKRSGTPHLRPRGF